MIIEPSENGWYTARVNYNGHILWAYGKSNTEALRRLFLELTF